MKKGLKAFLFLFLPLGAFGQTPYGAHEAFTKDQARLYLQMYQQMLTQTYFTEENLSDAYFLWAALGLYGPPTLQSEEETTS